MTDINTVEKRKEFRRRRLSLYNDFEVSSLESNDKASPETGGKGFIKYVLVGLIFGVVLVKGEVISWFRIQEMFRFQSFHMYGVIGTAVIVGMVSVWLIKKFKIKSIDGEEIKLPIKNFHLGQIFGGVIFGLGWAMTGACPGPIFAQIGTGVPVVLVVLLSAIAGTWVYGYTREKLPH